jgi:hypothetical protein
LISNTKTQTPLRNLECAYKAKIAMTRPTTPPAEPIKGTLLAPAALEDEEGAADPVAVDFVPDAAAVLEPLPVALAVFAVTSPEVPPAAGPTVCEVGK